MATPVGKRTDGSVRSLDRESHTRLDTPKQPETPTTALATFIEENKDALPEGHPEKTPNAKVLLIAKKLFD